ncbi:MAG: M56 family metallopeptidase [Gaiellaceae bacterium]
MRGAPRLYRLSLLLSGLGLVVVALSLAATLNKLRLDLGSLDTVVAACRSVLPALGLGGWLQLALALLATATLVLGARSLTRQLRATRRYLGGLQWTGETAIVAGTPCLVTAERSPLALCAGYVSPRIYVSQGALDALAPQELRAVVAHELHHRERRDPLRILVARVLADALFFLPVLKRIADRYATLVELAADEASVRALGERRTLARALLKFGDLGAPNVAVARIAPERVDHLSGDRDAARWRLSPALLAASVLAVGGLLAAVAIILAAPGAGSLNLALALAQSCVLLIATGTLALGLAGGRLWRVASEAARDRHAA